MFALALHDLSSVNLYCDGLAILNGQNQSYINEKKTIFDLPIELQKPLLLHCKYQFTETRG